MRIYLLNRYCWIHIADWSELGEIPIRGNHMFPFSLVTQRRNGRHRTNPRPCHLIPWNAHCFYLRPSFDHASAFRYRIAHCKVSKTETLDKIASHSIASTNYNVGELYMCIYYFVNKHFISAWWYLMKTAMFSSLSDTHRFLFMQKGIISVEIIGVLDETVFNKM